MSEIQKSSSEVDQELVLEAQGHLANIEALVRFRELHPEIFEAIAPKVKAILTEGDNPIVPVLSEEEIKEQILTKPRKNKYGLVMDPLEQELENIKMGFMDILRFDPNNSKHGNAYRFYRRIYNKYQMAGVVYQDDISIIDPKLLNGLKNFFQRKTKKDINDYLPSRTHKTKKIVKKISDDDISKDVLSVTATSLLRHHT